MALRRMIGYMGAIAGGLLICLAPGELRVQAQSDFVAAAKTPCTPGGHPESGLQGQQTSAERFSAPRVTNCNLELVGQYVGEGAGWGGAVVDNCAYYSQVYNPVVQHQGIIVVDIADPRSPKETAHLDSKGLTDTNETMDASPKSKLLAGVSPYYVADTSPDGNLTPDPRIAKRTDSDI